MPSDHLTRYFDDRYRSASSLERLVLRQGEPARVDQVKAWLPPLDGRSVLDAGAGDGSCLADLLTGRPRSIQIEDLSRRAVELAAERLAGRADSVGVFVGDCLREDAQPSDFDVTLAIGLLDYQPDLRPALQALLRRTRGVLIANVPRVTHPRNWVRSAWFATRGIPFRAVGRRRLIRMLQSLGPPFAVAAGPFEWLLKVAPGPSCATVAGWPDREHRHIRRTT